MGGGVAALSQQPQRGATRCHAGPLPLYDVHAGVKSAEGDGATLWPRERKREGKSRALLCCRDGRSPTRAGPLCRCAAVPRRPGSRRLGVAASRRGEGAPPRSTQRMPFFTMCSSRGDTVKNRGDRAAFESHRALRPVGPEVPIRGPRLLDTSAGCQQVWPPLHPHGRTGLPPELTAGRRAWWPGCLPRGTGRHRPMAPAGLPAAAASPGGRGCRACRAVAGGAGRRGRRADDGDRGEGRGGRLRSGYRADLPGGAGGAMPRRSAPSH